MQYKIAFVVKLSITYFKWDNKPRRLVGAKSIHAFLAFFHGLYFLDTNGTDCAIFNLNAIGIAAKEHRKIKLKNNLNNNELKREIGLFSITVMVIANMVGTGIFTTSGFIIQELENPQAMLICWLVGGVFALCGALCFCHQRAFWPLRSSSSPFIFVTGGVLSSLGKGLASGAIGALLESRGLTVAIQRKHQTYGGLRQWTMDVNFILSAGIFLKKIIFSYFPQVIYVGKITDLQTSQKVVRSITDHRLSYFV
jgi:hypothetical protein